MKTKPKFVISHIPCVCVRIHWRKNNCEKITKSNQLVTFQKNFTNNDVVVWPLLFRIVRLVREFHTLPETNKTFTRPTNKQTNNPKQKRKRNREKIIEKHRVAEWISLFWFGLLRVAVSFHFISLTTFLSYGW